MTSPTPTTSPTGTQTRTRIQQVVPFGVQMFGEINDAQVRAKAQQAGIRWVRYPVGWIETPDTSLRNAETAGLEIIAVIGSSPDWATDEVAAANGGTHYGCGPIDDEDLPAFADHVRQLAERYDGDGDYDGDGQDDGPAMPRVRYWEFWNEPDNQSTDPGCIFVGGCWGGDLDNDGIPDPREYVTMLSYAYPAVKVGNPYAQVLLGALAWESISTGCFNMNFLDDVLSYGGAQYFDLMNFHQYDFKRDDWDGWQNGRAHNDDLPWRQGILGKIAAVKEKVDKAIVISEIGLNRDMDMGEERQARHLVHALVRGMSLWPEDVKGMSYFLLVDEAFNPTGHYGLLERGTLDPFPAYYAYGTLTTELGDVDPSRQAHQLGPSETGSVFVQAYRFTMNDGRRMLVLWTDDGKRIKHGSDLHISMAIGQEQLDSPWTGRLRVVDSTAYPTSAVTIIEDGGPGDLDGRDGNNSIMLLITQDPIYVEATS